MQPGAHKTLTPTTGLSWETSNTQKDKLSGTEFSGVIPTLEMNPLGSYFWLLLFALLTAWNEAIPQRAWAHGVLGTYKMHGDSCISMNTET